MIFRSGVARLRHGKTSPTGPLLILIFFSSLLALVCAPYGHNQLVKIPKLRVEDAIAFSALSISNWANQGGISALLNQTTRMEIYNLIVDSPGIHFRAVASYLNLPFGVLQYHLGLLVNRGLLSTYRDGRYKRYFESKRFSETEMKVISLLRHETSGEILLVLSKKPQITHKDLTTWLDVSSQALSWQMTRLGRLGLVKRSVEGLTVKYSLAETVDAVVARYTALLDKKMNSTRTAF